MALVKVIQAALAKTGLPAAPVQYIESPDRALVGELLTMDQYVDMIIRAVGANPYRLCKDQSTILRIIGGFGVSHLYVDESADPVLAIDVIDNAKVQRPSACNALDTLLVNEKIAAKIAPLLVARMNQQKVTLVAEPQAFAPLQAAGNLRQAGDEDFDTEWLSLTLGVLVAMESGDCSFAGT